jgi:chromosome segregation ATPase
VQEIKKKKNKITLELDTLEGENNKIDKLNEEIKNRIKKDQERLDIQKQELETLETSQAELNNYIMEENSNISGIKSKNKILSNQIKEMK